MEITKSNKLYSEALHHIPGGVNSPVRSFASVNLTPLYIKRAQGSKIYDVDGNEFIDYVGSWGPAILGHSHPKVLQAVQETLKDGLSFGACCEQEVIIAQLVKKYMPSIELLRMVNSGTEATMSAIRLARGFTKKHKIIKFTGCYHGHSDSLLTEAGSGLATFNISNSDGVPDDFIRNTLLARYNSFDDVENLINEHNQEIAAIIIEPIAGNMGLVLPQNNFLQKLRQICDREGILLIFDEVMTGFRVARGGAQELYKIVPDITVLGKIIGGGLPAAAYGGREDIMRCVAPVGKVYQAGTLSGNPIALTAGITTLRCLENEEFYFSLGEKTYSLTNGLQDIMKKYNIPCQIHTITGMWSFFFKKDTINSFEDTINIDRDLFQKLFKKLLSKNIYLPPSPLESCFISDSHTDNDIQQTLISFDEALAELTRNK